MSISVPYQHQMFAHGRSAFALRGICHGQAPAVVDDLQENGAAIPTLFDVSPSHTLVGLRLDRLFDHSSRREESSSLPFGARRLAVSAFAAGRQILIDAQLVGHIRQDLVQRAHPHFNVVLSKRPVLVGPYANENGLTHAQRSFAPGAKSHD